jgi:aspartate aminotransferase-like enzyme
VNPERSRKPSSPEPALLLRLPENVVAALVTLAEPRAHRDAALGAQRAQPRLQRIEILVVEFLFEHREEAAKPVARCETPSGTLNPVGEIGPIARAHGAITICDAVSSLAGDELRPDDWGLDICVSGPQKCLGATPGISLVTVNERAWDALRANPGAPRRSYVSLLRWKER